MQDKRRVLLVLSRKRDLTASYKLKQWRRKEKIIFVINDQRKVFLLY